MPTIPPWLAFGPQNILEAAQAGAALGEKLGSTQQSFREEAAKRQLQASIAAANLRQQQKELQVQAALKQQEIAAQREARMMQLQGDRELHDQQLKLAQIDDARQQSAADALERNREFERESQKTKMLLDSKSMADDSGFTAAIARGESADEAAKRYPSSKLAQQYTLGQANRASEAAKSAAQTSAEINAARFNDVYQKMQQAEASGNTREADRLRREASIYLGRDIKDKEATGAPSMSDEMRMREIISRSFNPNEDIKWAEMMGFRQGTNAVPRAPQAAFPSSRSVTVPELDRGNDRVSVISPSGKVGTIPRSQLEEALKQGYRER